MGHVEPRPAEANDEPAVGKSAGESSPTAVPTGKPGTAPHAAGEPYDG
jgi:hypothetical protein